MTTPIQEAVPASRARETFSIRNSTVPYLSAIFISIPLSVFSFYLFGTSPVLKGHSLGVLFPLAGFLVSVILWFFVKSSTKASTELIVFGLLLFALWSYVTLRSLALSEPYNHTAWLLPAIVVMVLIKPPSRSQIFAAADIYVFTILAIAFMSHILHVTDIHNFPHLYYPARYPEIIQSIFPMQTLGLDYRWEGPFGSVSDAGPMGAFIFIYGLFRTGIKRIMILSGGLFILVFAFSFSSIFATLVSLVFLLAVSLSKKIPSNAVPLAFGFLISVTVASIALYIWRTNPTFNGRIPIWVQYVSEWPNHKMFGAGSQFLIERTDLLSNDHGHNLYVDMLLRYGLIGVLLFLALLISLAWLAWLARKCGTNYPIALLLVFVLCVVGETLVMWRYTGMVTLWIIISALVANSAIAKSKPQSSFIH
jgi:O-antigen ligase